MVAAVLQRIADQVLEEQLDTNRVQKTGQLLTGQREINV